MAGEGGVSLQVARHSGFCSGTWQRLRVNPWFPRQPPPSSHRPLTGAPGPPGRQSRPPAANRRALDSRLPSAAGRSGGTGRRAGLKIRFPSGSGGSIPPFGIYGALRSLEPLPPEGAEPPSDARFSRRVFALSFAPLGPPLTLAPRLLRVTRTPGASLIDFLNPKAIRSRLLAGDPGLSRTSTAIARKSLMY